MHSTETIPLRQARRLALARAGLLKPVWAGFPTATRPRSRARAEAAALEVVRRFGYLQLDTVSIAGARSHVLVLLSRIPGFPADLGEELLRPGGSLFEYWGHEASWLPIELYPTFEFRRRAFRRHPWWGDVIEANRKVARDLVARIRDQGPIRSADMEGRGSRGWWDMKVARRVASALWSSGELAIRERRGFLRSYDLAERVIPEPLRERPVPEAQALETLLLQALEGHGWATPGTLAATWRLRNRREAIGSALRRLVETGAILPCALADGRQRVAGFIRPQDLELADRLANLRLRRDRGVLLSPFDPLLWDRPRVSRLFGFDQVLEIFKPAAQRTFGYYCMPVLAGERLIGRFDLQADRKAGRLRVLSAHAEPGSAAEEAEAAAHALGRHAEAVGLEIDAVSLRRARLG